MIKFCVWSGDSGQKKICTVAWRDVCKSREEGGLAVKDPSLVNKAFLLHLCWKMLTLQDQWAVMARMRFMKNGKPRSSHLKSSIWLGLRPLLNDIFQHATWTVGNGESIYFWTDRWLAMPIVDIWQIPVHLHKVLTVKFADFVIEDSGKFPIISCIRVSL